MVLEFRNKRHATEFTQMIYERIRTDIPQQIKKRNGTFQYKRFYLQKKTAAGDMQRQEIEIRWRVK